MSQREVVKSLSQLQQKEMISRNYDRITGGAGADLLNGGVGADSFINALLMPVSVWWLGLPLVLDHLGVDDGEVDRVLQAHERVRPAGRVADLDADEGPDAA